MFTDEFAKVMAQFGPLGLIIGYLIAREAAERKDKQECAKLQREITTAENQSREKLASSLMALSIAITGRSNV